MWLCPPLTHLLPLAAQRVCISFQNGVGTGLWTTRWVVLCFLFLCPCTAFRFSDTSSSPCLLRVSCSPAYTPTHLASPPPFCPADGVPVTHVWIVYVYMYAPYPGLNEGSSSSEENRRKVEQVGVVRRRPCLICGAGVLLIFYPLGPNPLSVALLQSMNRLVASILPATEA
jgi:hypothetical protein